MAIESSSESMAIESSSDSYFITYFQKVEAELAEIGLKEDATARATATATARSILNKAIDLFPDKPVFYIRLAFLVAKEASRLPEEEVQRQHLLQEALTSADEAVRLSPYSLDAATMKVIILSQILRKNFSEPIYHRIIDECNRALAIRIPTNDIPTNDYPMNFSETVAHQRIGIRALQDIAEHERAEHERAARERAERAERARAKSNRNYRLQQIIEKREMEEEKKRAAEEEKNKAELEERMRMEEEKRRAEEEKWKAGEEKRKRKYKKKKEKAAEKRQKEEEERQKAEEEKQKDLKDASGCPSDARFDATQYAFFGQDAVEEVDLGGLDDDGDDPVFGSVNDDDYYLFDKDEVRVVRFYV
ncbi:hypothetical protein HS088_TW04G00993 [Tripterygium wilfordii]|uniref:Uncharacterized protein n=1 Tax=Tripterygium wilfordii TaxID=458696 RepID=A0A7J7DRK4_TRIWF|nr:hypothetical protein HS088_TW04G00993 [Tripterygium wilfordii]